MADGQTQVLVRMPSELHAAIKATAAAHDRSMAQEIRHAIRLHIAASAGEVSR